MICKNCGEEMLGDGYSLPLHCVDAYEEDWWYSEPDSGPWYCQVDGYVGLHRDDEDDGQPDEMQEWFDFDPYC